MAAMPEEINEEQIRQQAGAEYDRVIARGGVPAESIYGGKADKVPTRQQFINNSVNYARQEAQTRLETQRRMEATRQKELADEAAYRALVAGGESPIRARAQVEESRARSELIERNLDANRGSFFYNPRDITGSRRGYETQILARSVEASRQGTNTLDIELYAALQKNRRTYTKPAPPVQVLGVMKEYPIEEIEADALSANMQYASTATGLPYETIKKNWAQYEKQFGGISYTAQVATAKKKVEAGGSAVIPAYSMVLTPVPIETKTGEAVIETTIDYADLERQRREKVAEMEAQGFKLAGGVSTKEGERLFFEKVETTSQVDLSTLQPEKLNIKTFSVAGGSPTFLKGLASSAASVDYLEGEGALITKIAYETDARFLSEAEKTRKQELSSLNEYLSKLPLSERDKTTARVIKEAELLGRETAFAAGTGLVKSALAGVQTAKAGGAVLSLEAVGRIYGLSEEQKAIRKELYEELGAGAIETISEPAKYYAFNKIFTSVIPAAGRLTGGAVASVLPQNVALKLPLASVYAEVAREAGLKATPKVILSLAGQELSKVGATAGLVASGALAGITIKQESGTNVYREIEDGKLVREEITQEEPKYSLSVNKERAAAGVLLVGGGVILGNLIPKAVASAIDKFKGKRDLSNPLSKWEWKDIQQAQTEQAIGLRSKAEIRQGQQMASDYVDALILRKKALTAEYSRLQRIQPKLSKIGRVEAQKEAASVLKDLTKVNKEVAKLTYQPETIRTYQVDYVAPPKKGKIESQVLKFTSRTKFDELGKPITKVSVSKIASSYSKASPTAGKYKPTQTPEEFDAWIAKRIAEPAKKANIQPLSQNEIDAFQIANKAQFNMRQATQTFVKTTSRFVLPPSVRGIQRQENVSKTTTTTKTTKSVKLQPQATQTSQTTQSKTNIVAKSQGLSRIQESTRQQSMQGVQLGTITNIASRLNTQTNTRLQEQLRTQTQTNVRTQTRTKTRQRVKLKQTQTLLNIPKFKPPTNKFKQALKPVKKGLYNPSFVAKYFKISAKVNTKGIQTGLGVRPIALGTKKKRRKRK